MSIEVVCTCGKRLRARDEWAGKRGKCTQCGRSFVIPTPTADDALPMAPDPPRKPPPTEPPRAPSPDADTYGVVQDEPREAPRPIRRRPSPPSDEDYLEGDAPARPARRPRAARHRPEPTVYSEPAGGAATVREYMYCVLILALVPLAISLFQKDDDVEDRLERTLRANPLAVEQITQQLKQNPNMTKDEARRLILNALPGERIEGAHLPRSSWGHWLYAFASAVLFFGIVLTMFHAGAARPQDVILVGVFTATVGILFLLAVQFMAHLLDGRGFVGRSVLVLILWVLKFIAFSYRSALDPENNFFLSLFGFTFGVGLCEELVKALPLLWHYRRRATLGWRGACLWGLATGVGFGVSEGITYSSDFYNGVTTGGIYVTRFVSCVALHAVWSASVALTIWKCQELIQSEMAWYEWAVPVFRVIGVAMLLHGLYDTLLKKEMNGLALLVALVSFGWLVAQIELARRAEGGEALEAA